jgi:hypothetical protein
LKQEKENFAMKNLIFATVFSQVFRFTNLGRVVVALALLASISTTALAQYGGPGSTPGSTPSYGSKGAVIGGAVAGAAAGAGLLYWKLHNRSKKLQGCVTGDGDKLVNEKDNQTYRLTNTQKQTLKTGERFELLGKKTKADSGELGFEVQKMSKDLGQCTVATAEQQ